MLYWYNLQVQGSLFAFSGKISLVVEPVVAVITNQADALQKKGIDFTVLGPAAGIPEKSINFHRVFKGKDIKH